MKIQIEKTPAYQGRGWQLRGRDDRGVWAPLAVNSEWSPLEAVMLYSPDAELRKIRNPLKVQHLAPVVVSKLRAQMRNLASVYRKLGVKVVELDPTSLSPDRTKVPPNLMFLRDLFFATPEGAIVSRMASRVRAGEEKFATSALGREGIMIRSSVAGDGIFEGADALWLTPRMVVVGIGQRTNMAGFRQVRAALQSQGIACHAVPMPKGVQHLLGLLQIVGPQLAVVRTLKAPATLLRLLKKLRFRVIHVQESDEIKSKLGLNFVAIGPRKIVMPAGCPVLRKQLEHEGIRVLAEVEISQMCNAAGGIGCVTGILSRKRVR